MNNKKGCCDGQIETLQKMFGSKIVNMSNPFPIIPETRRTNREEFDTRYWTHDPSS